MTLTRLSTVLGTLAFATTLLTATPFAQAASPAATLTLRASDLTSNGVDVAISVDTSSQAVSLIKAVLTLNGFHYVSSTSDDSDFSSEVTPPVQSSNTLTITRARYDTGYTGATGKIATVHLTANDPAVGGSVSVNTTDSQIIAYSDSSNILENGTVLAITPSGSHSAVVVKSDASPTPSPAPTTSTEVSSSSKSYAAIAVAGVIVLAVLGWAAYRVVSRKPQA